MLSIVQLILAAILMWIGIALSTGSKKGEMEDSSSGTKATTVTVWQILVLSVVPACITIVLSIANICIFVFANTCPWPCLPGGDCWPGAKARKAKERMQLKKLKAKGKEARQPCRKHWGPQLAVLILVLLQMVPEFIASIYMFVSSDELSSNIDTEEAAASISKLNFFNVALGESDVKNVRPMIHCRGGCYYRVARSPIFFFPLFFPPPNASFSPPTPSSSARVSTSLPPSRCQCSSCTSSKSSASRTCSWSIRSAAFGGARATRVTMARLSRCRRRGCGGASAPSRR